MCRKRNRLHHRVDNCSTQNVSETSVSVTDWTSSRSKKMQLWSKMRQCCIHNIVPFSGRHLNIQNSIQKQRYNWNVIHRTFPAMSTGCNWLQKPPSTTSKYDIRYDSVIFVGTPEKITLTQQRQINRCEQPLWSYNPSNPVFLDQKACEHRLPAGRATAKMILQFGCGAPLVLRPPGQPQSKSAAPTTSRQNAELENVKRNITACVGSILHLTWIKLCGNAPANIVHVS